MGKWSGPWGCHIRSHNSGEDHLEACSHDMPCIRGRRIGSIIFRDGLTGNGCVAVGEGRPAEHGRIPMGKDGRGRD